jgi:alkyl hydroperoxide reductase subunit AhpC
MSAAQQNYLRIGDKTPDFEVDSQLGKISWHKYIEGKWACLFSHPRDFTPVCTTELGAVARYEKEFASRNVLTAAISVDTVEHHKEWIKDIEEIENVKVNYPILADVDRKLSVLYGMLDQTHLNQEGLPLTVRAVYIIDPSKVIRLIIIYPASTGRNFDEIIRVIDSLQLAGSHKVATPANWKKGDKCMVLPTVSTEEAQKLFKEVDVVRPWLRKTPDPSAVQK